ncbi:TonB-dependent receptor plug domain-containing protein [Pseudoxanthomonas suwonensis]|uniref:TonB-dependent receptor n=1 Tax=Pseudoxanthomonas suwonensis TaxID=314722 RepID=A0A0E3Z2F3_9GAMM|nr:TonB-dependent receptor [Pseudoxanthomonas suwonensis]AKC86167.1 hypothetical protein WQ53_04635 [Pseudoxanthomonas suwonensis]
MTLAPPLVLALALHDPAATGGDATPGSTTATLQTVEVTGSHIRRVEFETAHPLLVLDRERLRRTGLNTLGEVLQQLPQHVAGLNTDFNNGGNGETYVDLRNLGSFRTLVLLNGRRYVAGIDGSVDVSSIPLAIVERVEVLTDGASAIYGSDAIGGVVNIITRNDYDGMEAGAQYATSEYGDGQRRAADFSWGHDGERGGVAASLSYADQQPVWAGDRAISSVPVYGLPANDVLGRASFLTPDGSFAFGPGGNLRPDGRPGRTTWDAAIGDYRPFNPRQDSYNYAPENYLRTPYQRLSLFATAQRTLPGEASLRAGLLLQRRRSAQELAPTPIVQYGGGNPGDANISSESLYNPFGQPVTQFSFRPLNQSRRKEQDALSHNASVGLEGVLTLGSQPLDWRFDLVDARARIDHGYNGGYDLRRLAAGIGPSFLDAQGRPRCGTPSSPVADCLPLDFLHGRDGFTDAMFDYLKVDGEAWLREERGLRDATFAVSAAPFRLPAGQLAMAAGLEWREERGRITMDPLLADDRFDFGGFGADPVDSRIRVREAWLELDLPLLAGKPWAEVLSLSLAARHSRYSSFGATTNGKLGAVWRPHAGLLLRGTWSSGFRAPSPSELYGFSGMTQLPAMAAALDPCLVPANPAVAARCHADGVPADGFDPPMGPRVQFGSNPGLQPERARNRNLGVVWSPDPVPGLGLSLDWWRIRLFDTIAEIPIMQLPAMCYLQGLAGACQQLARDPATGTLTEIDGRLRNYGTYELEGYDVSASYRRDLPWGRLQLRWDSVYLDRFLSEVPVGAPPTQSAGNYFMLDPGWRLRSVLSLDWDRERLGATLRLRHYSPLDESCVTPTVAGRPELCSGGVDQDPAFPGQPVHVIAARTYTDLQLRWRWGAAQFALGVNNAFDLDPPVSYDAYANSYDPSYDIPGRFWHMSYRQRF